MTRINIGIDPSTLTRQHLLAEHREMKRIPNMVKSGRVNLNNIPDKFSLGTGHVRFFYDKLLFLLNRYKSVYTECLRRGYNVTDYSSAWEGIDCKLMNNWTPSYSDAQIVQKRINEKLLTTI